MSLALLEEFIESGNARALNDLLEKNPSLASENTNQQISPLMLSCYYKKPDISSIILKYVKNISIFEAAAVGKFDEVAHLIYLKPSIVNDFSEDGFTPLGLAAYFGNEDITRYLLLKEADPNLPSKNGYNVYPLHSAVASDHTMIAKMLLEAGAKVNISQMSGVTPLHSAAQNGNIELLIVLLEAGALVNVRMEGGKTPADLAADKGYHDIAKILSE
ncbi:ankyrin repeat domain-containing protein [Daejeonella oryzae]|uniref:ankyrin repeat domain-containing protein n=1 Tax=Daejeonella oryzae TaxID=1122943 RepID=UPI0004136ADC|nr:ankyrin repeat domain-containing protein [Daejeonella oryzae]